MLKMKFVGDIIITDPCYIMIKKSGKLKKKSKMGKIIKITDKMVKIETSSQYNGAIYKQSDKIIDISALERNIKNEL